MNLNFKNFLSLFLLSLSSIVSAQSPNIGLVVGDTLPIFKIPKLINSNGKSINTSDYREKLLIIDFWAITCSNCIEALPKMEALEKKFGSILKILPVTTQLSEDKVLHFLKNNTYTLKYTKDLIGPSVVEDTIFKNYFKHKLIPHEVWVYKGKIIAITSLEYVDEYNINKVLRGENINWPIKNDFYEVDLTKPLFTINQSQLNPVTKLAYVAMSDFKPNVNSPVYSTGGSGIYRDNKMKTVRTFFLNQGIADTYLTYWSKLINYRALIRPDPLSTKPNQIVWEVSDRSRYIYEKKLGNYMADWIIKNGICFESLVSDTGQNDKQIFVAAIHDLNRLLGLNVRWEKRTEKVYVLKKNSKVKKVSQDRKGSKYSVYDIYMNFNAEVDNPYLFNESGDNRTEIKLDLNSWNDVEKLGDGLEKAGFTLSKETRSVDKLIFTEVGGSRLVDGLMQTDAKKKKALQLNLSDPTIAENESFLKLNMKLLGVHTTKTGLQYKVIKHGVGELPLKNGKIIIHYEGRLVNGKIFDSSYERGIPLEIKMQNLIEGWSEALLMMKEGSEWELYIPSALAYGSHTGHGSFPPNSTMIFTIKLIKVLR